jgi:ABC-type nitrate/sulfonate/bicarbonate transport system substrate-binding protein
MHRLVRRSALPVVALIVAFGVGACGSSSSSSSSASTAASSAAPATKQDLRISLDFSENVDYLGIYAAINQGYFAQQGINPKIIPYANTPAEVLVKNGATDLGISYPPDVVINRTNGLKYKAVAALVQHNTTALAVLASSPYKRPADLNGKLYGGFGVAEDPPIITTMLRNDGVAHPVFRQVVLTTDAIDALGKHRVDYSAVFGGIDDVTAALHGVKLRTFPFKNYLGPAGDYPNAVYVATDAEIANKADLLRRGLKALAEGYAYAAAHPAAAEEILIKDNPTALGNARAIVTATGNATAPTFLDSTGHWGVLKDSDFSGFATIFSKGNLMKAAPPPVPDFYTNSLLPTG